jgi:hypothetical protein
MSDDQLIGLQDDTLVPERASAKAFGVCVRTLVNWDANPKMAAIGWEGPIVINNRRYRRWAMLRKVQANLKAQVTEVA